MPELTFTRLAGDPEAAELLVVGPSLGTDVTPLWGAAAGILSGDRHVVGWDLPGHGLGAPTTEPFSVRDLAEVVLERTTEFAGERPTAYAGVSLGGAVGLEIALRPGPFRAVSVIASAPKFGDPAAWHERAELVRRAGTPAMVASSTRRWFATGFLERDPGTANRLLIGLSDTDRESYARACEALAGFDLCDRLGEIDLPLLVVAGQHDIVVPPDLARKTAAAVPGALAEVLPGVAHLPTAEDPRAIADVLTGFLEER